MCFQLSDLMVLVCSLAIFSGELLPQPSSTGVTKRVSFTFDDLPAGGRIISLKRAQEMTRLQLDVLKKHGVQAVGFVNESKLFRKKGEVDERIKLLDAWLEDGHLLGNHTFSHPSLAQTPLEAFKEDVVRGETVTRILLDRRQQELIYFRHPFLRTGADAPTRNQFEAWLSGRGYTVAPVTLENEDYIFAAIYERAKARGDEEMMTKTADAYLAYTAVMIDFLEGASRHLFQRQIHHVMLLHANELNAECSERLIQLFKERGYGFASLQEVLRDPAYGSKDVYVGPAGVNWLFRWDHARGRTYDWRAEPRPPQWVMDAFANR